MNRIEQFELQAEEVLQKQTTLIDLLKGNITELQKEISETKSTICLLKNTTKRLEELHPDPAKEIDKTPVETVKPKMSRS